MPNRFLVALLVLATALAGCAGSAWRKARSDDSISAYHGFLREYPDSSFSDEARARLELARIRHKPSLAAFRAFQEKFPDPALLAELRPHVAEIFLGYARAVGTADAYREFLDEFPSGAFRARAEGNAIYLEQGGFRGDVEALGRFAAEHPESDYAAEAERSVAAVRLRNQSGFSRVGLAVVVDPATPGADRLRRAFRERAAAAYARSGLELAWLENPDQASRSGLAAVLRIEHQELETRTQLDAGRVTEPGIHARTVVSLARVGDAEPIWSDTFEFRAPLSARRDDLSILFSPGSHTDYWADLDGQFFVPVARWSNQVTAREPQSFSKPAVAVKVVGNRAVVLFGDGDFHFYDLSDPARPVKLGEYRRKRDLASFGGVSVQGARVAIYGADGIEMVRLDGEATQRERVYGRDVVGSVIDVEAVGDTWLAATNRGLLQIAADASVSTLVPRPILGMARLGERVAFSDGTSLFVSTLPLLRAGRVESELRLGRGFHPQRVRVHGETAVVIGDRDAVWVDLRRPSQPRLLSRIGGVESGRVRDAAIIGNRLFLLGPRGLQVADRRGEKIVDSVDVAARQRIDVFGRHLVMIGENALQVVDATAFVSSAPAAPSR